MCFQRNVTLLLERMDLVVVELNAAVELDTTEYAEVAGVELVGGTDLVNGRGRLMERDRDRRRESWLGRHAAQAGVTAEFVREPRARVALASSAGEVRPTSGGASGQAESIPRKRGRVVQSGRTTPARYVDA
jgi:hypothetical protein